MSTNPRIYLDHNASSPLAPPAQAAIGGLLGELGNPSSVHAEGRRVRDVVERARDQVARLAGRPREQVVFTSGGTEANVLGVLALARVVEARGGPRVIAAADIDHPCLRGAVRGLVDRGWTHHRLEVDEQGALRLEPLPPTGVLAYAAVNHELGTLADAAAVTALGRAAGALIHVDAVQAAGKCALGAIEADALAISAHKLGGPLGVGALALALDDGLPWIDAGHHERGRRPGTENVLGIAGFGAAVADVDLASWGPVVALGDALERGVRAIDGARIHGADAPRIGGTINAGFEGALGESIVIALDLAGIAVSTGAACTSGSIQPSAVLLALGMTPTRAREAVRFSLGRTTTAAEIATVVAALPAIALRARRRRT